MATTLKRAYTGKDVDMLTACETIIDQAIVHKTFLITKRPKWANPFLPNLKARINTAFADFLSVDNAQQLRASTQVVIDIQTTALNKLAEFKVQIMEDFKSNKNRRTEILNLLGFTSQLKKAQTKDQEALIELLYQFKKNMTATLQTEITKAGMSPTLITTIKGYATTLKNSNISQETLKGSRKVISQAGVTELNAIYTQVISIAKIASTFFKDDKAIKDKFSYAKTLSALNLTKVKTTTPPTTTPPTT